MTSFAWYCGPSLEVEGLHPPAVHQVGAKAAGLLRVDPDWVPPTLFLAPAESFESDLLADATTAIASLPLGATDLLKSLSRSSRLIVRSSATGESMRERGSYISVVTETGAQNVAECIAEVWDQAIREQQLSPRARIGIILQPFLAAHVAGHLSNEYRLNREYRQWTNTIDVPSRETSQWRIIPNGEAWAGSLTCASIGNIVGVLRRVAATLSSADRRLHLEWLWDGKQVWIVQADTVEEYQGPAPGDAWAPTRGRTVLPNELAAFRPFNPESQSETNWPKLKGVKLFAASGLPTTQLYVLSGRTVLRQLAHGYITHEVRHDLRLLASGHVVIRTDISGDAPQFMLPKTKATCDLAFLEGFLIESARALTRKHGAGNVAFIAHRFLRARGAAWASASPEQSHVEVHANWGLPDGLNWLPHDSYAVDIQTGIVRRSVMGKTNFLDVIDNEAWTYREAPSEWIWRAVLSDFEAREIATATHRLARGCSGPVLIMWFSHLLDGASVPLLPWFMAREKPTIEVRRSRWQDKQAFVIRTRQDLLDFRRLPNNRARCLILEPSEELIRDHDFIEAIANLAKEFDAVVEMQGSPLAHAYYLLRKSNVIVYTRENDVGQRSFGKLVRDRIPDQVEQRGEFSEVYVAQGIERARFFKQKLVEEALEVRMAMEASDTLAELADVEEVVDALLVEIGRSRLDLGCVQRMKGEDRGGFAAGRVLISTSLSSRPPVVNDVLPGLEKFGSRRNANRVVWSEDRLRLPLLPPGPLDAREEVLTLASLEQQVHVRYGDQFVDLEFVAAPTYDEDPAQTSLF